VTDRFSELWDANPLRYRIGSTLLKGGAVILPLAGICAGVAAGTIGLVSTLVTAAIAAPVMLGRLFVKNWLAYNEIENIRSFTEKKITDICNGLFKKAGLPVNAATYILDVGDNSSLSDEEKIHCNHSMAIFTYPDRSEIYIGKHCLENLSEEQLSAFLAHETGHRMGTPSILSGFFNQLAAPALTVGLAAGCAFSGNFEFLPVVGALHYTTKFLQARANRLEERRADRNALALYPHPEALLTGLQNALEDYRAPGEQNWKTKSLRFLFSDYPRDAVRFRAIEKNAVRVEKFYAAHNLTDSFAQPPNPVAASETLIPPQSLPSPA
jgi:Zn-dependent protease with chaperone function